MSAEFGYRQEVLFLSADFALDLHAEGDPDFY